MLVSAGCSSPTAPTPLVHSVVRPVATVTPLRLHLLVSGQSNAGYDPNPIYPNGQIGLGDALQVLADVRRVSQGGVPISVWQSTPPTPRWEGDKEWLWPALQALLRAPDQVDAFVWFQGESDATDALLPGYASALQDLLGRVRTAQPNAVLLICGLEDYTLDRPHWNAMRVIQQQVAGSVPRARYVPTDDLPVNGQHLTQAGYARLAERILTILAAR